MKQRCRSCTAMVEFAEGAWQHTEPPAFEHQAKPKIEASKAAMIIAMKGDTYDS